MGANRISEYLLKNATVFDESSSVLVYRDIAVQHGFLVSPHSLQSPKYIDCSENVILPGFRDAHVHFSHWIAFNNQIDLTGYSTNEILRKLKQIGESPIITAGQWVPDIPLDKKQNFRKLLDEINTGPILIYSKDLHTALLNTESFMQLGWMEQSDDQPEEIIRDELGRPTGIVREIAVQKIEYLRKDSPRFSTSEFQNAQEECFRQGVTSVISVEDEEGINLLSNQDLKLEIQYFLYDRYLERLEAGWKPPETNNLKFYGIKIFLDGSLGSATAWMYEPYLNSNDTGVRLYSDNDFRNIVQRTHNLGYPVMVHAIGDRACAQAVRILSEELTKFADRIEHFQIVNDDILSALNNMKITIGMQPCHLIHDRDVAERFWGIERMRNGFPIRTVSETSSMEFGSDAPVEPINPLRNLIACEDTWNPDQTIGRIDAIKYSVDSKKLYLSQGAIANLVVFPKKILTIETSELEDLNSEITFSQGELVWIKK